mmetsp:Transcript_83881/g.164252  ORF Transcript_83881/g.164252 Transcript_83881/m.164252 type:complete len:84 (+) Transcript_83881:774-1025(+)
MATDETPVSSTLSLDPGGVSDPPCTTSNSDDKVSSTELGISSIFLQREAKRMARNPCLYFWIAFLLSTAIAISSVMAGGMTKN